MNGAEKFGKSNEMRDPLLSKDDEKEINIVLKNGAEVGEGEIEPTSASRKQSLGSEIRGNAWATCLVEEMKGYEALDYNNSESELMRRKLYNKSREEVETDENRVSNLRWGLTAIVGIFTALTAVLITFCTGHLLHMKLNLAQTWIEREKDNPNLRGTAISVIAAVSASLSGVAGLAAIWEPVASGSGIPEIKSLLNGIMIKRSMRIKTLFAKATGVVFAVAGGLPVGKEGPMIHTGAIMGAGLSQGKSSTFGCDTRWSKIMAFRNDMEKRDFIACGAAAGVAAAFGAPLGGVMFILEEGASWWHPELTWRALLCAMISAFVSNMCLSGIHGSKWGLLSRDSLLAFGGKNHNPWEYSAWEIPCFVLLGVIGGALGIAFNAINERITRWRRSWPQGRVRSVLRYIELIGVCLVVGFLSFGIPMVSNRSFCRRKSTDTCSGDEDLVEEYTVQMYCDDGDYDPLATLWFNSPEHAIKFLFYHPSTTDISSPCNIPAGALVAFGVPYLLCAVVTYGVATPSGLFLPMILSGAAFGRLSGMPFAWLWYEAGIGAASHGTYALIGAAAMLGGVTRMTISLTVIMIETTGSVQLGLPIFLTALAARVTGNLMNEGLYDIHIALQHVPFLPWDPPKWYKSIRACDIMSHNPITVSIAERAGDLLKKLKLYTHNGFPVVVIHKKGQRSRYRRLCGMILRKHLCQLLSPQFRSRVLIEGDAISEQNQDPNRFSDASGDTKKRKVPNGKPTRRPLGDAKGSQVRNTHSTRKPLDWSELEAGYPHFPVAASISLTQEEEAKFINLRQYCDPVPHMVPAEASVWHVYNLFRQLGLRHLCVIDNNGDVIGVITRQDLTEAHCRQCFDIGWSTKPSMRTWHPLPAHKRKRCKSEAYIEYDSRPTWTLHPRCRYTRESTERDDGYGDEKLEDDKDIGEPDDNLPSTENINPSVVTGSLNQPGH